MYFLSLLVFSSSITDTGLGMICDFLPDTLSKLLVALCPNITSSKFLIFWFESVLILIHVFIIPRFLISSILNILAGGIQFATAQLPLLELMDCGMTVSDPNSDDPTSEEKSLTPQKTSGYNQKMFIKHKQLKKLSLWGCSSLDVRILIIDVFSKRVLLYSHLLIVSVF